jgi:hypothetical protein
MELITVTYQRRANFIVNGKTASDLRARGYSLTQIKATLNTPADLSTISRAIKRANEKAG